MTKATCCHQPCPMTLGVYVGAGRYVCWLHLLGYGRVSATLWNTLPHIGLEPG